MASDKARAAVRAAKSLPRWGGFAARRYAERNGALDMYLIAVGVEWKLAAKRSKGGTA